MTPPLDLNHKSRRRHYYQETVGSKTFYFLLLLLRLLARGQAHGSENFEFFLSFLTSPQVYCKTFNFICNNISMFNITSLSPLEQDSKLKLHLI